jgi:hypothetical protein
MRKYITYSREPHIMVQYELWLKGYKRTAMSSLTGWIYVR